MPWVLAGIASSRQFQSIPKICWIFFLFEEKYFLAEKKAPYLESQILVVWCFFFFNFSTKPEFVVNSNAIHVVGYHREITFNPCLAEPGYTLPLQTV